MNGGLSVGGGTDMMAMFMAAGSADETRERLRQLAESKASAEAAMNDLALGMSAVEAHKKADALRKEYEVKLAAAEADAAGIRARAQEVAGKLLAEANDVLAAARAEAKETLEGAKAEARALRANSNADRLAATQKLEAAQADLTAAASARAEAEARVAALDAEIAATAALRAKYEALASEIIHALGG